MVLSSSPLAVSLAVAAGALVALLLPWLLHAKSALLFLSLSLIIGQALRLPLPGQGGGLLLSDGAVVAVVVSTFCVLIRQRSFKTFLTTPQLLMTTPFLIWSVYGLLIQSAEAPLSEIVISAAYWFRLVTLLLLLPALMWLGRDVAMRIFISKSLFVSLVILVTLGYVQWWFLSDFSALARFGWDPHQGRLTSTWLDPNLFGGFLVLLGPWSLAYAARRNWLVGSVWGVYLLGALLLTQSRSSLVALVAVLVLLSPFLLYLRLRRPPHPPLPLIVSSGVLIILIMVTTLWLQRERLSGILRPDATVSARAEALTETWHLFERTPFIGVGYNRYQFVVGGEAAAFTIHSRAGSDNSFLTLGVTTGIVGLALFLLIWCMPLQRLVQKVLNSHNVVASAALVGLVAWFIHANFVNSLLYSHLLIAAAWLLALMTPVSGEADSTV